MQRLQVSILRKAANLVRTGGRIVYSTCSFNPEENERVIEAFLMENKDSFQLQNISTLLPETLRWLPVRLKG